MRGDQAGEQSADHAARRQRQIKCRQMFGRRPLPRKLAMARHRDDEEREQMPAQRSSMR